MACATMLELLATWMASYGPCLGVVKKINKKRMNVPMSMNLAKGFSLALATSTEVL